MLTLVPIAFVAAALIVAIVGYLMSRATEVSMELNLGKADVVSNIGVLGYVGAEENTSFPGQLTLHVRGIYPGFRLAGGKEKACIENLDVTFVISQSGGLSTEGWNVFNADRDAFEPLCTNWDPSKAEDVRLALPLNWNVSFGSGLQSIGYFTYPFDTIWLRADFRADVLQYDAEGKAFGPFKLPVEQFFGIATQSWVLRNAQLAQEPGIILERPLLVRIMVPLLALFLLIPIFLIPQMKAPETAIEMTIASFVGVWGVRQAFLPGVPPGMTLIDVILLAENGAAVLGLAAFFAARRLQPDKQETRHGPG